MKIMKTRISLESKDLKKLHEALAHVITLFDRGNEELSEQFFRETFILQGNRNWLGFAVSQKDKDLFNQQHKEQIKILENFVYSINEFNSQKSC